MSISRRNFLKLGTSFFLSTGLEQCIPHSVESYSIDLNSSMKSGHHLMKPLNLEKVSMPPVETLIVGGGIAGITAAYTLKNPDFVVCELSKELGGSSGSSQYQGIKICQGAHYDLNYPDYFGEEVLAFLEDLNVIEFNKRTNYWDFKDKQYLIDQEQEGQSLVSGVYQEDVLYGLKQAKQFLKLTQKYQAQWMLPTRLIPSQWHYLNRLTFRQFLQEKIVLSSPLLRALNYQMKDDFGGTTDQVSALAGLYYYASRPYWDEQVHIFSPPQGNYYFIEKMLPKIPQEQILTQHLVQKIVKKGNRFAVEVLDLKERRLKEFEAKQLIYAGQKHALQYTYPPDYPLFKNNRYAPWVVINFILKEPLSQEAFWQNEIPDEHKNFLGFVDSRAQYQANNYKQVLTAYYCFAPQERKSVQTIQENPQSFINETIGYIGRYFKLEEKKMKRLIEHVMIKAMGHAMPIPGVDYLLNDKNRYRSESRLVYAGVDNSRLPLFLEAVDSALEAVKLLEQLSKPT